jgi:hypothetical protein
VSTKGNPGAEGTARGIREDSSVSNASSYKPSAKKTQARDVVEWKPFGHSRCQGKPLTKRERMRRELPYGVWVCGDGTLVLFNRGYAPIWKRTPDGTVTRVKTPAFGKNWVKWEKQYHFFNDSNPPWRNAQTRRFCEELLESFGVGGAA